MNVIRGEIPSYIDAKGVLSFFEYTSELKFTSRRVFWITNVASGTERGNHAHYTTKQILICIRGRIKVKLHDGTNEISFFIKENDYVVVPEMIWDSQIFYSTNDILLVLANTDYSQKDYITDFETFKKLLHI